MMWQPDSMYRPYDENGSINEDDMPADLQSFFISHGLNAKFRLTIKKFNNELYTGRPSIAGEFVDEVPKYEAIVGVSGPAWYRFVFVYKKDPGGNKPPVKEVVDIPLVGAQWDAIHEDAEEARQEQWEAKQTKKAEKQNFLKSIHGGGGAVDPMEAGKKYLEGTMGMLTPLLDKLTANGGGDNAMIALLMESQRASTQATTQLMIEAMRSQSQMMIALLGNNRQQPDQTQTWDKAMNFMGKMFEFQAQLAPKDESFIQKVGNVVADNLSTLMELFSKPQEIREQDTMYKKITEDKRMQAVKSRVQQDKAFALRLITHLDKKVGCGTTDKLLRDFIKYRRPDEAKDQEYEAATNSSPEPSKENQPGNETDYMSEDVKDVMNG